MTAALPFGDIAERQVSKILELWDNKEIALNRAKRAKYWNLVLDWMRPMAEKNNLKHLVHPSSFIHLSEQSRKYPTMEKLLIANHGNHSHKKAQHQAQDPGD
jgi:hypothetical protein